MNEQIQLNFKEADEINPQDLEAASDLHDRIMNTNVLKNYNADKIIATLTKRIESAQKKADNISTELSGNWTHKRGEELAHRIKTKEKLESFIIALSRIKKDWENGYTKVELLEVRSVTDIEFILYNGYPNPIDKDTAEWRKKEYPKKVKKAEKLGLTSRKDNERFKEVLSEYLIIEVSEAQKKEKSLKKAIESLRGRKIPGFYPTPQPLIHKMLDYARMHEKRNMDVLEPSAGIGDIADEIKALDYGHEINCIEINFSLCKILEMKGHVYGNRDLIKTNQILNIDNSHKLFDRIIMNPPFEKGQDIEHITHCYNNFLKEDGILVSVASNSVMTNAQKKYDMFRELVAEHGQFVELEGGEFKEAFKSTGVSTVLVILNK